jgi:tRNA1(Val) A37 N6-methylase TrmN6
VLEPTCGVGAFLMAARERFAGAKLRGYEVNPDHADAARARLAGADAEVTCGDFFSLDWARELASLPDPLLVIGNPPWVTAAGLGALGAKNLPASRDAARLKGLDALTGRSNFDVSEAMLCLF